MSLVSIESNTAPVIDLEARRWPRLVEDRPVDGGAVHKAAHLSAIREDDPDVSIFQQPWWLEAVSDNRYQTVTAGDGNNTYLWWPFVERRLAGFSRIGAPQLTHTLGPVIRLPEGKPVSRAAQRRKLINAAVEALPRADGVLQVLDPRQPHAIDYQLLGFDVGVRYTYQIATDPPVPALWRAMKDKTRNGVREARKHYEIGEGLPLMAFHALYDANLRLTGRVNQHDQPVYSRLSEALARRDRHCILTATDRLTGKITAAVLLVWDATSLYYFRATQDASTAPRGASSLLVWEAICKAAAMGLTFDSDGFLGPAGAAFIDAFGATPVERLMISRRSMPLKLAEAVGRRVPRAPAFWT